MTKAQIRAIANVTDADRKTLHGHEKKVDRKIEKEHGRRCSFSLIRKDETGHRGSKVKY